MTLAERQLMGQAQANARNAKLIDDKIKLTRDLNGQRDEIRRALDMLPATAANKPGRAILQGILNYREAQKTPRKTA